MSTFRSLNRRRCIIGAGAVLVLLSTGVRADETKTAPASPSVAALEFSLKTSPYRPMAGSSATVTATVKATAPSDKKEKRALAGLFFVREDLGQLFFDEPVIKDETTFEDTIMLPSGGEWRVFGNVVTETEADNTPGTETIVGPVKLGVDGVRAVREPLIPQMQPSARVANYTITLKQPTRITAEENQTLVFTLLDGQTQQVSDMDIWRDALAHLVLVDKDAKTLLHVTPDRTDPRTGRTGSLVFPTRFPKSGIWRGWVLFHRNAQVVSLPLVLRVLGR